MVAVFELGRSMMFTVPPRFSQGATGLWPLRRLRPPLFLGTGGRSAEGPEPISSRLTMLSHGSLKSVGEHIFNLLTVESRGGNAIAARFLPLLIKIKEALNRSDHFLYCS